MVAFYVESASGVRWERGYKIGWPCQASGLDLSLAVMVWIAYCVGSDVGRVSSQSPPYCTQNTGIQQSSQKKLWRHPRSSALLSNWLKSRSHHIIIRLFTQVNIARWQFWPKTWTFWKISLHASYDSFLPVCPFCKRQGHTWSRIMTICQKLLYTSDCPDT